MKAAGWLAVSSGLFYEGMEGKKEEEEDGGASRFSSWRCTCTAYTPRTLPQPRNTSANGLLAPPALSAAAFYTCLLLFWCAVTAHSFCPVLLLALLSGTWVLASG